MKGTDILQSLSETDNDLITEAENALHQKTKLFRFKYVLIAAACLTLCCAGLALATTGSDTAYQALYAVFPGIAQKLKPVNVSCTDNGIEMYVSAAEISGDKATILVSMRDITGNRLDETTDLFDSYSIHTPYDQGAGCSLIGFDSSTKTATFMPEIRQNDHVLIPGDKITFSVSQLLTGKKHSCYGLTQIDMNSLPVINDFVINPDGRGWSVSDNPDIPDLMVPDSARSVCLEQGVTLTGYGIIDGKLHVQIRYDDIGQTDNHGNIRLKKADGSDILCESSISFWDEKHTDSYEEYIFPVPAEELNQYTIWGEFWTCNEGPIQGNWQVTFSMVNEYAYLSSY